jgi:hypothetical protein
MSIHLSNHHDGTLSASTWIVNLNHVISMYRDKLFKERKSTTFSAVKRLGRMSTPPIVSFTTVMNYIIINFSQQNNVQSVIIVELTL